MGEVTGMVLATVLANGASAASVPSPWTSVVLTAAPLYAAGRIGPSGMVSLRSISLAKGVMRFMLLTKLKLSAGILGLAVAGTIGVAGVGLGFGQAVGGEEETGPLAAKISRSLADDEQPRAPVADTKDAETKTLEKLKGTWKIVQTVREGEEDLPTKDQMIFDGKELTVKRGRVNLEKAVFEIDPSSDPMTIDFAGLDKDGKKVDALPKPGIIKIEKDKLTICHASPSPGVTVVRPKEFTSTKENKFWLIVLEREKP
jgi:uncharacterized protein (TIGR03067 family)